MRFEYFLSMTVVFCAAPMGVVSPVPEFDTCVAVPVPACEHSVKRICLVDAACITAAINATPVVWLVCPLSRDDF